MSLVKRLLLILMLAVAGGALAPLPPAMAQQQPTTTPDYARWEQDATRAENTLEADRASSLALEQLRAQIVDWRTRFAAAQSANAKRIETLNSQIAALGPVPDPSQPEADEIAQRRNDLNSQLAALKAPGLTADEAYRRADGIIRQIDAVIRERQADALLRLSPTPLNPANWPAGWAVLTEGMRTLWAETTGAWQNPARRTDLRNNLPIILLYLLLAGLLVLRGPGFMERLTERLQRGKSLRVSRLASSAVSLGQIFVPLLGLILLVAAIQSSGMTGLRSGALILSLPVAGFAFFAARWLGASLFSTFDHDPGSRLTDRPREGRIHVLALGLVTALEVIRRAYITDVRPPLSMAAQAVWAAPLVCIASVFLFRLGTLLRRAREPASASEPQERQFQARMVALLGLSLQLVAILGPLLALVGYVAAANALVWPSVWSLALIGLLILLQRFGTDIYQAATGGGEEQREALIPVLLGMVLILASLPVFALLWGARTADLSEVWTQFLQGISVGGTRLSPSVILVFLAVFAIGYIVTRLIQGTLRSTVLPRTRLDKGVQNALGAGVGYFGVVVSALAAVTAAGINLSSLAIVIGALSVGIGLGLQNIVQNFVSGIILLIERPISEGDMIQVGTQTGIVRAISVRSTRIETFDRTDVIVPNSDLVSGVVTNLTRQNLHGRLILPVGVAYGSDTRKVETILREIAEAHPIVMVDPPPAVFFIGFGADSLNFEIRVILSDVNMKMTVTSEMNHQIYERLSAEGIDIPFAQRDIWLRNPEVLFEDRRRQPRGTPAPALRSWDDPEAPAVSGAPRPPPSAELTRPVNNDPSEEDPIT
jgi:small-conductance mechanosensitive channel